MRIANRLQAAREKLEISQEDAAEKWGLNLRTLQNWECGRNEPRGFARAQLDKLLDGILGPAQPKRSRTSKT